MTDEQRRWLQAKIRTLHKQMPGDKPVAEAWAIARVGYGKYRCAHCQGIFGPTEMDRDHVEPVIDPAVGYVDWNTWFTRLDAPIEGWQILCKPCHKIKTKAENSKRKRKKKDA